MNSDSESKENLSREVKYFLESNKLGQAVFEYRSNPPFTHSKKGSYVLTRGGGTTMFGPLGTRRGFSANVCVNKLVPATHLYSFE